MFIGVHWCLLVLIGLQPLLRCFQMFWTYQKRSPYMILKKYSWISTQAPVVPATKPPRTSAKVKTFDISTLCDNSWKASDDVPGKPIGKTPAVGFGSGTYQPPLLECLENPTKNTTIVNHAFWMIFAIPKQKLTEFSGWPHEHSGIAIIGVKIVCSKCQKNTL